MRHQLIGHRSVLQIPGLSWSQHIGSYVTFLSYIIYILFCLSPLKTQSSSLYSTQASPSLTSFLGGSNPQIILPLLSHYLSSVWGWTPNHPLCIPCHASLNVHPIPHRFKSPDYTDSLCHIIYLQPKKPSTLPSLHSLSLLLGRSSHPSLANRNHSSSRGVGGPVV